MSAIPRRSRAPVAGAAVLLACALLTAAARGRPSGDQERDAGRDEVRAAIETAFRRCDATTLESAFSRRVKTYLASRALGIRPGYYGADQALLLMRRGFAGRRTLRFRLYGTDDPPPAEGRCVLPARWLFRDGRTSKSDVRLSFTLAREGAVWTLREIRELK